MGAFPQIYPCPNVEGDAWSVFTNKPAAGAMRGYGIPQAMWAGECHIDDVARTLGRDPVEYRWQIAMPKGYVDAFSKNENYYDTFRQVMEKGAQAIDYQRKRAAYADQTGPVRRGVGMALFWYNTAVWPISLETSSCRMVLNQTAPSRCRPARRRSARAATPPSPRWPPTPSAYPLRTYISSPPRTPTSPPSAPGPTPPGRPTWGGFALRQTGQLLKERILAYAQELTRQPVANLDLIDGKIVRITDGRELMTLGELATEALYSLTHSRTSPPRAPTRSKTTPTLLRLHLRRGGGGHPPVQGEAAGPSSTSTTAASSSTPPWRRLRSTAACPWASATPSASSSSSMKRPAGP